MLITRPKRFTADRQAIASIEFAISGIAVSLFLMVVINLGYLGLILGAMQHGAGAAAREAAVQTSIAIANGGSCTNSTQVQNYFAAVSSPPLPAASVQGGPSILTSWTNNAAGNQVPGTYVTVTASYTWSPIGVPAAHIPLTLSATQMVLGTSGASTSCT